jgi:dihydrofolate reductase
MGRRTWEAIGRPLPGRMSVVLSRDASFRPDGATMAAGWDAARAIATDLAVDMKADEIAVIGGAEVFRRALPGASTLHLTLVHASVAGDVVFPAFDRAAFIEITRETHPAGPEDEHHFTFVELRRRTGEARRRT